jgi:TetR/AcrR family transcriptional regulator
MSTSHIRFSAEDRRNQILDTATELFARQGFEGTTTRQIAENARVNEAIIFRHFPSKEELYWAVIEHQCQLSQGRADIEARLESGTNDHDTFVGIADDFLRRREQDDRLGRLLLFSALENHGLSHRFFQTHIAQLYERIGEYIQERIDAGAFRQVDPVLAARAFLGMLVYHFMIQELFGARNHLKKSRREVAEELVDIWLHGVISHNGKGSNGKSRAMAKSGSARKSETYHE